MRAAHHYCAGQRRRRDRIAAAMIQRARDRCRAVALVGWRERTAECVARRALLKRALGNPTLGYPLYGDGLKTMADFAGLRGHYDERNIPIFNEKGLFQLVSRMRRAHNNIVK